MKFVKMHKRTLHVAEVRYLYQQACRESRQNASDEAEYQQLWLTEVWPAYRLLNDCFDAISEQSPYQDAARAIIAVHSRPKDRFALLMHNPAIIHAYNLRYQRPQPHFKYLETVAEQVRLGEPTAMF